MAAGTACGRVTSSFQCLWKSKQMLRGAWCDDITVDRKPANCGVVLWCHFAKSPPYCLPFKPRLRWGKAACVESSLGLVAEGGDGSPLAAHVTWRLSLCEGPITDRTTVGMKKHLKWGIKRGIWRRRHAISPCDYWLWTACPSGWHVEALALPSWPPAMRIMGATEKKPNGLHVCSPGT